MTDALIVDSHVHFWDPTLHDHAWLEDEPELLRTYRPDDLPSGAADVAGMVFVQADCRDEQARAEVAWVTALAERFSALWGIVAHAPLERGDAARADLEHLSAQPLVVGVRRLLQSEPLELFARAELIAGLRLLAEFGLPFDLCVTDAQLRATARLVERVPDVTFVLDHLGKPDIRAGARDRWREDLRALAGLPNAYCKLSGLATLADPGSAEADSIPYLEDALEAFGPARCMFGSDWPVATKAITYEGWIAVVGRTLDGLAAPERAAVLAGNAIDVYDLRRPGRADRNEEAAHAGSDVLR